MNVSLNSRQARIEPLETRIAPAFVTGTVNLADLNGTTGSAFHGAAAGDYAGQAVSAAGDVNGDGFGDFIVGASKAGGTGAAYVIFGTAAGFPADATLDTNFLDGTTGFALLGEATGDRAGYSVGAAGDVNGDGFDDVIVGAPVATGVASASGAAYVVFGKARGFAAQVALDSLDGSAGFKLSGAATTDRAGWSVSGAGDVNHDGFDDVIVGAYRFAGTGAAFILYGKAGGFGADLTLSGLNTEGVQLNGAASGDQAGISVSRAGDVNGDGFADVVVGANVADEGGTDRGAAYVVFGAGNLSSTIELGGLTGGAGFRLKGGADKDYAGQSVSGAGDVNGDGFDDVIVGASNAGNTGLSNTGPGAAYVILGKASGFLSPVDLSMIPAGAGFALAGFAPGEQAGKSVSGAGDVNGDGFADLLIGLPQNGTGLQHGRAYVVFGQATPVSVTLAGLSGSDGFGLGGEDDAAQAGHAVSGAGDVNGDGFADLLVSTPFSDDGGTDIGKTYLVLGGPSGVFIQPDSIASNLKSATWTDVDGDLVTLKLSRPSETLLTTAFHLLAKSATDRRAQLLSLTLDSDFDGADVSITVTKRAPGGDGKVNVGFIDATGVDLGNVIVGGDLGRIDAGGAVNDLGLKSLTVGSFGLFEGRTQDTASAIPIDGSTITSTIKGAVGPLKVAGDMRADFNVVLAGSATDGANLASVTIGGSLLGGETKFVGDIFVRDRLGPVKIAGDVRGGSARGAGYISAGAGIASLAVGGSLLGGSGSLGGSVRNSTGAVGPVTIGGSVLGGSGFESGAIIGDAASIGKVSIKGDLIGGTANHSGVILTRFTASDIAGVTIGGDARAGSVPESGGIFAAGKLGPVVIGGDAIGTAAQPFTLRGGGALTGTKSLAVASVKVGGDFEHALILGGYGANNAPVNGHAQIGAISVGGDWIASSVSAGLLPSPDAFDATGSFGNGDDVFINAGPANVVAYIQSVTIKGAARGTFEEGDRFAIVAEQIGSVSIGGAKLALTKSKTADPANDINAIHIGATPDFVVREISRGSATQPADPVPVVPAAGARSAFPAAFALGTLASADGFKLTGVTASDFAGQSVSAAGDVNGDGFDDFIVGAYFANEGGTDRGAAYVVFGQAGGLSSLNLSALDGTTGFKLRGIANADTAGKSVSGAGDVNGDGFDDLIVGAPSADEDHLGNASDDRGAAYVIFGRSSFASVGTAGLALSTLDGSNGFTLLGEAANDNAGAAVSGAGDVNGDGFDDVIIGAKGANAAYVVLGKSRFASAPTPGFALALGSLGGDDGFKLTGEDAGDGAGGAVSGAGDVNGDGFDDVIVGALGAEEAVGNQHGAAYVVFGASGFSASMALGALQGTAGLKLTGTDDLDNAGSSVGAAGDVNGDGFGDVIVGAYNAGNTGTTTSGTGAAYVVFGRSSFVPGPVVDFSLALGGLTGGDGFKLSGLAVPDRAGNSASGAGDVNGDGFADLIVGAYLASEVSANGQSGAAYVVFGKSRFTGTPAAGFSIGLGTLDGGNGFKLSGAADGDYAGRSVSAAGDINGDGFGDVIVGVPGAGANDAGAAHVVYGGPSGEFIDPAITPDGKTARWTDVDGDLVTLKVSKGTLDATNFKLLAKSTADTRAQLLALNLGSEFDGADVTLTAKRAGSGDGKVNVGAIDGVGVDFGAVKVGGDLGSFRAGDVDAGLAFKSLTVGSLGVFGGRTQDTGGQLLSALSGPAGALKVLGDFREATFAVITSGVQPGTLASVTIGGDLTAGTRAPQPVNLFLLGQVGPGTIAASNSIGPVKIGGDLVGGPAGYSGYFFSASIASVSLGGSLVGGAGLFSGAIIAGSLGNISVGGDQRGGAGLGTGYIAATSGIGNVSIRGDQIGAGTASGLIFTQDPGGNIASVTIGGDARGGDAAFSGGILAGGTLGPVSVKGDIIGTTEHAYTIRGSGPLTGTKSVAITSLKVGGDFDHALVLAGYGNNNTPANGHVQIGAISVGGDWIASSVTAGLLPRPGALNAVGVFGNDDDTFIAGGPSGVVASIASITIKGRAIGTLETGDRFGIVAESIGSVSIGGAKLALTAGFDPGPFAIGPTPDFVVREVARV